MTKNNKEIEIIERHYKLTCTQKIYRSIKAFIDFIFALFATVVLLPLF